MNGISCDACGKGLLIGEDVRYVVRIDARAAYDVLEIGAEDLERDLSKEIDSLLDRLASTDAEEAQNQVHRVFRFDLCVSCHRAYLRDPLRPQFGG